MKKTIPLLLLPMCLVVGFTLMPTGTNAEDVLAGYQSTTSFAKSSSSYLLYMMQFSTAGTTDYDQQYASSVGDRVAYLATSLCEELGNGGSAQARDQDSRKDGQFRYSTNISGYYDTAEILRQNVLKMLEDENYTCNISCCAFATFCWERLLSGQSPYGTQCAGTIADNFQNIIEGDGTASYIEEHASPGDILFYTEDGSISPPVAVRGNGPYVHAEVYIGRYEGVDATGSSYSHEHAVVGSNQPGVRRDVYIKSLQTSVSSGRRVFLVSLEKWIAAGNPPIDNSDQVETIESMLEY